MKRRILWAAGAFAMLTAAGIGLMGLCPSAVLEALTITAGTFCYHFAMRLMVGYAIDGIFHNRMNGEAWWFRERSFEKGLYGLLRVRRWKGRMPTFAPESFDIREKTAGELIAATCQAEAVHEIIMVLSFLPVAASVWFGAFWVFFVTSMLAALMDGMFVVLQRYNRPRLRRLEKLRGK